MDRQVIYRKTAKGLEEMATRAYRLPARERSLLILVDAKRNAQELIDNSRHLGDSSTFLEHLFNEGFIEPVGSLSAEPTPPAEAGPTDASAPPPITKPVVGTATTVLTPAARKEVINFARKVLFDNLGPDADTLAARIEASRNQSELYQALEKGRDALQAIVGRRKAEEFWQGVVARLPANPPPLSQR